MMAAQTQRQADGSLFLRRTLYGNSAFSVLSGILLIVAAGPIATLLGLENAPILGMSAATVLRIVGVGTVLFAAGMFRFVSQPTLNRRFVMTVFVLDAGWVIASVLLLVTGVLPLSAAGSWAVLVVADIAAVFAVLEFIGLRRME